MQGFGSVEFMWRPKYRNGNMARYAFAQMRTAADAQRVIDEADGVLVGDEPVKIRMARPRRARRGNKARETKAPKQYDAPNSQ